MTIQWKQFSDSSYDCVAYDLVKNRLSESQAEAEEQNQSFPFCFWVHLTKQPTMHKASTGFPRNKVCGMSVKIPYWWRVTTQIWVVPASDLLKICFILQPLENTPVKSCIISLFRNTRLHLMVSWVWQKRNWTRYIPINSRLKLALSPGQTYPG